MPRNGWTFRTLKEYFDGLMVERDRRYAAEAAAIREAVNIAASAATKAVEKAEAATERRFESVNEFRSTLTDQTATFISRMEHHAQVEALKLLLERQAEDIRQLRSVQDTSQGERRGTSSTTYVVGAVLALVLTAVGIVVTIVATR